MTLRNATYGSESAPLPASYSGAQAARAGVQWMVPSFPTRFTFPIVRCELFARDCRDASGGEELGAV